MRVLSVLSLTLLLAASPAWAYRALTSAVEPNQGPVKLVSISSSLQDTSSSINNQWDTTLTLQRQATKDLPVIQDVEVEFSLLGSQGDVIEQVVSRIVINGPWQAQESRQVRLVRAYLGWPPSGVTAKVRQVNYAKGDPWVPAPVVAIVTGPNTPDADEENFNLSGDSPYFQPTILGPGGANGGGGAAPAIRPTRPRPVRPRPTAINPIPQPPGIPQPPSASTNSPFRTSPFTTQTGAPGTSNGFNNGGPVPGAPAGKPPVPETDR